MAVDKAHESLIESVCDYKKKWIGLDTACRDLSETAGLSREVATAFLKSMNSVKNITQIRGYSKEDYQTLQGKIGKSNEAKK
jgi:hypothetical protein